MISVNTITSLNALAQNEENDSSSPTSNARRGHRIARQPPMIAPTKPLRLTGTRVVIDGGDRSDQHAGKCAQQRGEHEGEASRKPGAYPTSRAPTRFSAVARSAFP